MQVISSSAAISWRGAAFQHCHPVKRPRQRAPKVLPARVESCSRARATIRLRPARIFNEACPNAGSEEATSSGRQHFRNLPPLRRAV
jgi:hypothetical protein